MINQNNEKKINIELLPISISPIDDVAPDGIGFYIGLRKDQTVSLGFHFGSELDSRSPEMAIQAINIVDNVSSSPILFNTIKMFLENNNLLMPVDDSNPETYEDDIGKLNLIISTIEKVNNEVNKILESKSNSSNYNSTLINGYGIDDAMDEDPLIPPISAFVVGRSRLEKNSE